MNVEKIYDLTPLQKGMLFHNIYNPESIAYLEQATLHFYEYIDVEKMINSFELLQQRFDVLRTAFYYRVASCPKQVVLKFRKLDCTYIDLIEKNERQKKTIIGNYKKNDFKKKFDLEKDSLMRIVIFRENKNQFTVIWSFHHIIIDGWSISLLIKELLDYYFQLISGAKKEKLIIEVQKRKKEESSFSDYVEKLSTLDTTRALKFWSNYLRGYQNIAEFPIRRVNKYAEQVDEIEFLFSEEFTRRLQKKSEQLSVTVSTILETVWGITLQHYTGVEDVVFGKLVSGRNIDISDIERIVGMCMNTIPVRIETCPNIKIRELLSKIQEDALDCSEYDFCPLYDIQEETEVGNKLIRTLYVFENIYTGNNYDVLKEIKMESEELVDQVEYPVMLTGLMNGLQLKLYLTYNPQVLGIEEMKSVLNHYKMVLSDVINDSEKKVADILRACKSEEHYIYVSWDDFVKVNTADVIGSLEYNINMQNVDIERIFIVIVNHRCICGWNILGRICACVNSITKKMMLDTDEMIDLNLVGRWVSAGKLEIVDKKRESKQYITTNSKSLPKSEVENKICNIYRSTMKIADYFLEDYFYQKGGSSLLGMEIHSRLAKIGINIPLKYIFEKNIKEIIDYLKLGEKK